jgi:hypothetical protein
MEGVSLCGILPPILVLGASAGHPLGEEGVVGVDAHLFGGGVVVQTRHADGEGVLAVLMDVVGVVATADKAGVGTLRGGQLGQVYLDAVVGSGLVLQMR